MLWPNLNFKVEFGQLTFHLIGFNRTKLGGAVVNLQDDFLQAGIGFKQGLDTFPEKCKAVYPS
jgi:hypothetical protein